MNIVFCCTGNTCRSPMAEQILQKLLKDKGIEGVTVSSCGIFCSTGESMNEYAEYALKKLGVQPHMHFARPISPSVIQDADLLICMTSQHKKLLTQLFGELDKVKAIDEVCGMGDVNDPFGGSRESYLMTAKVIHEMMDKISQNIQLLPNK